MEGIALGAHSVSRNQRFMKRRPRSSVIGRFANTRNAIDEKASYRVNWLIHVWSHRRFTFRKGEPGFGIHTRTAAHEPDAHTVVHFTLP